MNNRMQEALPPTPDGTTNASNEEQSSFHNLKYPEFRHDSLFKIVQENDAFKTLTGDVSVVGDNFLNLIFEPWWQRTIKFHNRPNVSRRILAYFIVLANNYLENHPLERTKVTEIISRLTESTREFADAYSDVTRPGNHYLEAARGYIAAAIREHKKSIHVCTTTFVCPFARSVGLPLASWATFPDDLSGEYILQLSPAEQYDKTIIDSILFLLQNVSLNKLKIWCNDEESVQRLLKRESVLVDLEVYNIREYERNDIEIEIKRALEQLARLFSEPSLLEKVASKGGVSESRTKEQERTNKQSVPKEQERWRQLLGPYFDGAAVKQQLGLATSEEVTKLVEQKRILALPTTNGVAYPAFQFTDKGKLNPTISRVVSILDEVVATPYTTASWLKGSKPNLLGGETPLEWLANNRDPECVIEAAEITASRLAN